MDVSAGARVVIPCKAPKGFPRPSITWLKDGRLYALTEGRRYVLLSLDECSEEIYKVVILRKSGQRVFTDPSGKSEFRCFLPTSGIISMIHEQLFQELGKFG